MWNILKAFQKTKLVKTLKTQTIRKSSYKIQKLKTKTYLIARCERSTKLFRDWKNTKLILNIAISFKSNIDLSKIAKTFLENRSVKLSFKCWSDKSANKSFLVFLKSPQIVQTKIIDKVVIPFRINFSGCFPVSKDFENQHNCWGSFFIALQTSISPREYPLSSDGFRRQKIWNRK